MKSVHQMQDLAPRDIVARQIYINIQAGRDVYLNATHLSTSQWQQKFPYIYEKLLKNNPANDIIPVSPAAHYSCGGISVASNSQTSVANLYAVGEVACTGLHGANRLASNSLLECIVYALAATEDILTNINDRFIECNQKLELFNSNNDYLQQLNQIRQLMWDNVGLVRRQAELSEAYQQLQLLAQPISTEKVLANYDYKLEAYKKIVKLAKLTLEQAIKRKKSVGSHFLILK